MREELKYVLKIKRITFLIIIALLLVGYIVYMSISIYRGYENYSRVSLDKIYYEFITYRNKTLMLSYAVSLVGQQSSYELSTLSRVDCAVNYNPNASIYSVFCLGNPEVMRDLFIGQGSRPYFAIVSLLDLFYNVTSEKNTSYLGIKEVAVYFKDMRIYVPSRYIAIYNVSLSEGYMIIYSDLVSGVPLRAEIYTDKFRLVADLITFTTT
ncbi:MAG: hypothetical protein ACP5GI_01980 [Sulfolobales archaeon]